MNNIKIAALYIATLKAISLIHQHNHWVTSGNNFYSQHLLFKRLYEQTLENLDSAAEKFIGLWGDECLEYQLQYDLLNRVLANYKDVSSEPVELSLSIEKDFLKFSGEFNLMLEKESKLTLGLDDMLSAIAGKSEESVYLLNQLKKG